MREAIERDLAAGGANCEQIEVLNRELGESREKVSSLTAALLTRTEELRALEQQGEKPTNHEHQSFDEAVGQAAAGNQGAAVKNGSAKVEPRRSTSPVLGSVMEQFGKLREQRSMNRSNNKPR